MASCKAIQVLRSCKTLAQLKSAIRYVNLAYRQQPTDEFRQSIIREWYNIRHRFLGFRLEFHDDL